MKRKLKSLWLLFGMILALAIVVPAVSISAAENAAAAEQAETQTTEEKENVTVDLDVKGDITEGKTKTIFITDAGHTSYYKFEAAQRGYYAIKVTGSSNTISLVFADASGTVIDIADKNREYTSNGYVTSDLQLIDAGTWYIGIASAKVCKCNLTISGTKEVVQDETAKTKLKKTDIYNVYSFTAPEKGHYQFYVADTRYYIKTVLCDKNGEELLSIKKNDYTWLRDESLTLRSFSYDLKKDQTCYIKITGSYFENKPVSEVTITRTVDKEAEALEEKDERSIKILSYKQTKFYTYTPKSTGTYYFTVTSVDSKDPDISVYRGNEQLIKSAEISRNTTDSANKDYITKELAMRLTAGRTYYIGVRFKDHRQGKISLKCRKLKEVKKITVLHKPDQKQFVSGINKDFSLSGTVISIRYTDDTSSKWVYDEGNANVTGFPVKYTFSTKDDKYCINFKYRGKKVTYSVPLVNVSEAYKDNPLIEINKETKFKVDANKFTVYRFIPEKEGLYKLSGSSDDEEDFTAFILGPKGKVIEKEFVEYDWYDEIAFFDMMRSRFSI